MLIENIKKEVLKINEEFKRQDDENYDFWNNHIKLVVKESLFLAERYGADKEIVEIGAMLHDIALMSKVGTKVDHHLNGVKISEKILDKYKVDKIKKDKILGCILHHRISKNAENIEELCVADADIISHFDNIPMCFYTSFRFKKFSLNDVGEMKVWFEKDFNDLSDRTKFEFKPRYENIMQVIFG